MYIYYCPLNVYLVYLLDMNRREDSPSSLAILAGATEEVAYVSGPLDARGGVPQAIFFGPQASFLLFFTCYEIRDLTKYLFKSGLFLYIFFYTTVL